VQQQHSLEQRCLQQMTLVAQQLQMQSVSIQQARQQMLLLQTQHLQHPLLLLRATASTAAGQALSFLTHSCLACCPVWWASS
jgi:hypothetical protein